MEQTLFIIKPEAFYRRNEIKEIIVCKGFFIQDTLIKKLTLEDVRQFGRIDALYKIDQNLFDAYEYFMQKDYVELGIIQGIDVVEKFKVLCGEKPNPTECEDGTLRKMFGKRDAVFYKKRKFFLNAVHKSNSKEDAEIEVNIFKGISENLRNV